MGSVTTKVRLEDLARIAGLSIATVSRALNDSPVVNRITKRRVRNVALEQGYAANRFSLHAEAPACTLGIFISSSHHSSELLFNPFYQQMIASVGQAARSQGCDLHLSNLPLHDRVDLVEVMATARVDGAVFIGQCLLHDRFNQLAETHDNFIVWGQGAPGQKYRTVGSDNLAGGMRATEHLAKLGRRRIVYLGDTDGMEFRQRFQGYLNALGMHGLAFSPQLVVPVASDTGAADLAMAALWNSGLRFDGVFAASDAIAFGAMTALQHLGLHIPDDVSVVGYDNTHLADLSRPRLTAVSQDLVTSGQLMVSKLVGTAANDKVLSEYVSTQLVVRESCGSAVLG